jgi:hypothetical protein
VVGAVVGIAFDGGAAATWFRHDVEG